MQNISLKNSWKYIYTNYTLGYRWMDWTPGSQESKLCIFNVKYCMQIFICEYMWMYDARYPSPVTEKGD